MAAGLDWQRDGPTWPHAANSHFVESAGQRWHVQRWPAPRPDAPTWLLLHGVGAATPSWRGLAPLLSQHVGLVVPDLPGHGFSGPAPAGRADMQAMAHSTSLLLQTLKVSVPTIVGHSAGAAIAVRMALQAERAGTATPTSIVGLNAALLPLPGLAGRLFSPAAKLLALNPLVPHFVAWRIGDPAVLARLLNSTGSRLDDAGTALYRRLVESPAHEAGALAMMARWNLPALAADLPRLRTPLHLLVADADRTIPPADAQRVLTMLPGTTLHTLPGLGHLAHEEEPSTVADVLLRQAQQSAARR